MKDVIMFVTSWCPHCKKATTLIDQLKDEKPEYKALEIVVIDEEKEKKYADSFDYYRVPTFYVDGQKVHEGVVSMDTVRNVFDKALK